jgi:hypothetical protein
MCQASITKICAHQAPLGLPGHTSQQNVLRRRIAAPSQNLLGRHILAACGVSTVEHYNPAASPPSTLLLEQQHVCVCCCCCFYSRPVPGDCPGTAKAMAAAAREMFYLCQDSLCQVGRCHCKHLQCPGVHRQQIQATGQIYKTPALLLIPHTQSISEREHSLCHLQSAHNRRKCMPCGKVWLINSSCHGMQQVMGQFTDTM